MQFFIHWLVRYDPIFATVLPRLAQARIFFSELCLYDELIIVLRELTIGLRTLILFQEGRRELTLDLR